MKQVIFKKKNWINIICIVIFAFLILPFLLFGKNCIITIHDNLDSNIPWFKYVRDNNYFFKINTKSTTLDHLSTLYFSGDFTFKGIIYYCFDTYIAYNIIYICSIVIGFFSMRFLLLLIFNNKMCNNIIKFVSLIYSILPTFPGYRLSVATLPFGISLFYLVYKCKKTKFFHLKYFTLSLFFPFISCFDNVLLFLLGYWFLLTIVVIIKDRSINLSLIVCFALMCIGTVLVNIRLFAMRLIFNETLNRDIYNLGLVSDISLSLKNLIYTFLNFFCKGQYHANSVHFYIILPLAFVFALIIITKFIKFGIKHFIKCIGYELKVILFSLIVITFNCIIITLSELQIIYFLLKIIFPPLSGLSFTRLYIFNNVMWYIIFASMLQYIINNSILFRRLIINLIIILQIGIVVFADNYYQDSFKSWVANLFGNNDYISYNEFYSTKLFEALKYDINYNGEIAIAVGYHPSVLMYNGFNSADGYISTYPMIDAFRFKKLIQPELNVNDWANKYYTSWWGRRYVYNKDLPFNPTKSKVDFAVPLRVDINYYKEYYNGKYIISRAEISNYIELGLEFVNLYNDDSSIYDLWVYKT